MLAFEETGWSVTQAYRVVSFFDRLIEQALVEQAAWEQSMANAAQNSEPASPSTDNGTLFSG